MGPSATQGDPSSSGPTGTSGGRPETVETEGVVDLVPRSVKFHTWVVESTHNSRLSPSGLQAPPRVLGCRGVTTPTTTVEDPVVPGSYLPSNLTRVDRTGRSDRKLEGQISCPSDLLKVLLLSWGGISTGLRSLPHLLFVLSFPL